MGAIDKKTLAAAKSYTNESLLGGGAVVGKNVTISSITPIDGGNRVTFSYTLDNGVTNESFLDVMNGKDGKDGSNTITPEEIRESVDNYLNDNPVQSGATDEQVEQIKQNTENIEQVKEDLGNYSLIENTVYSLALNIDSDYVMTLELKNADGDVLSSKSIDFPIESMVIGATYEYGTLTLTLQNGEMVDVDVSSLVSGLVNDTFTIAGIDMKDDITKEELVTALGIGGKLDKDGDASNTTATFTQASTRSNIASGEKTSVILGKIRKWFADLKTVAFTGNYNDLSNKPTIPVIPAVLPSHTYSYQEQLVGTWVDGKPLYEKTVNFGSLPNATAKSVPHGISNANVIWVHDGFVSVGSKFYGLILASTSNISGSWYFECDVENVSFATGSNRTSFSAVVIIRYTKTTD